MKDILAKALAFWNFRQTFYFWQEVLNDDANADALKLIAMEGGSTLKSCVKAPLERFVEEY